jgi:hypothetical protein
VLLGFLLIASVLGAVGKEKPPPSAKRIAELVGNLADDEFVVREKAEKALIAIGKPALARLFKAVRTSGDLEVRRRANRIILQIDPGAFRREELEKRREQLRKTVAAARGVDAKNWGEDITNPFTNLTAAGKRKLAAQAVDVDRLPKLRAVLITGSYCGALSKTFVNSDPDTILVLGKGFITHGAVYSMGPVLAVEDAHIMGSLTGADLVWFVERSWPRFSTVGGPLIAGLEVPRPHDDAVTAALIRGDYGWRRPADFLKLPPVKRGAKLPALAVADAAKKRKQLRARITAQQGVSTADVCVPIVNPFTNLTAGGKAKLEARGVDTRRLAKLKAVLLTGNYCGAFAKTFVNRDADTILVIGKGFVTHGDVHSLGPVLAVEDAHFMGDVTGADLVWFVDSSFPRGTTTGLPVILAPTANHGHMHPGSADVWWGDYGWRRPADFLKPIAKKR